MMKNFISPVYQRLWLTIILTIIMAGFGIVADAAAQSSDAPQLTVVAAVVGAREGPSATYPVITYLLQNQQVTATGYAAAGDWWQVTLPDGKTGWVSGQSYYVAVTGDTSSLIKPASTQAATVVDTSPTNTSNSSSGTIVFETAAGGAIYAIKGDGTNLRYLTTGMDPVLSPDGQWVVFTRWNGTHDGVAGNVWLINVDGSGEKAIHGNILNPRAPTWSSDGTSIVVNMQHGGHTGELYKCSSRRPPQKAYDISIHIDDDGDIEFCYTLPPDPHWGLRRVNVTTGAYEDLPNHTYSFSPTWDPADASRLVYDGDRGLINLNLVNGVATDLTTDVNDHSPVFSPDGRQIAVSFRQDDHWEIHVMNADGSGRARLTSTPWQIIIEQELKGETAKAWSNASPAWSPDGTQISFVTNRTGHWEIWVMNADGSNQRPLFDPAASGLELQYNGVDERMLSWR